MKTKRIAPPVIEPVTLAPDDGVFELAGATPLWIWVHTCFTPTCACRSALVLATDEGRERLLERGAAVRDAWNASVNYKEVALSLDGLCAFDLDIDSAEISRLDGEAYDPVLHPGIEMVAARIDGEVLESIGRLFFRGKGRPEPGWTVQHAKEITISDWRPGDMLAWSDTRMDVRKDYYPLDEHIYEADEMYCPLPECECGEVVVCFVLSDFPSGESSPGHVLVKPSGAPDMRPSHAYDLDRLTRLWAAFTRRHPRYPARFARRNPLVKAVGAKIVSTTVSTPLVLPAKVGRNDACPCGSGKKYKKCCGAN